MEIQKEIVPGLLSFYCSKSTRGKTQISINTVHLAKLNLTQVEEKERETEGGRERGGGIEAGEVSFREIKLVSLSVCNG